MFKKLILKKLFQSSKSLKKKTELVNFHKHGRSAAMYKVQEGGTLCNLSILSNIVYTPVVSGVLISS